MEDKAIRIAEKINAEIGRFFDRLEVRGKTTLFFLFFISLAVRLWSVDFSSLLWKDAFVYLLQALDIARGNFVPSYSQAVGLSLFSAPFFLAFGQGSIFHSMIVVKAVSCLFGAAVIFPLYLLAKELSEKRARILILVMFAFLSTLVMNATEFLTEPLFSFFLLFSLYFSVRYIKRNSLDFPASEISQTPPNPPFARGGTGRGDYFIYLSFFFAGLSYYVRPNGIFFLAILPLIYLAAGFRNWKKLIGPLLIGVAIFWLTASPFLIQRYEAFGSPFTYGQNDKYWVDTYAQVWANNIPTPTVVDYFRKHNLKQIFDRFVVKGLGRVSFDMFRPKDLPLLAFFLFLGMGWKIFRKEYWPLYISLFVFVGGLSVVYAINHAARYSYPLFPILIIFMAAGFYELIRNNKYRDLLLTVFIVCFIALSGAALVKASPPPTVMPNWAVWAAQNIKGKIATVEGGDFVIMNLPDATTAGVGQKDLYAPRSGVSVTRPGVFSDLPSALAYFKQIGLTHILIDGYSDSRPYLLEVPRPQYQNLFKRIYSNASSSDPWKAEIYEINWGQYRPAKF